MKFLSSKLAAYLTDMLCCVLLGTAVCAIFLPSAGFDVGYGDCLLLMLADTALIVLFTRKWWLLPAFLGAAVVITLVITTLLDANQDVWAYIEGFIRWCAASYPDTLPYSFNGSIILVQLAMALPAAVVSYAYYRRLFFFPILPPVVLALMLWIQFTGSDVFWPVLVILLLVMFLSIAKMTGNRINKSLPENERISSALLVMSALLIVPVVMLFAFSISPQKDGDWRNKGLVNLVEDVSDYLGWGDKDAPMQGTFNIGLSGFSPLEQRLGGNITPDNTIVMKVTTETPVLLKGAVYNTYDGQRWYDSGALRRFRLTGFLWQGARREVFGLDKPYGGTRARELFSQLTLPADLEISYLYQGRTLFFAGQVQSLTSSLIDPSDVFFNGQSELFMPQMNASLRYKLHTVVFDRNIAGFDENMLALEALTKDTTDNGLEAIRTEYLQLPDSLPDSVYKKAEELTQGCGTAYEKAIAIERWLGENCTYTLTPGDPPEGSDFVEHFLKQREGYCVYYASAMTVLARAAGLPARFVTGYALKRSPASKAKEYYLATNATAHAWTEVYFKGIGWVTFDALRWNSNENAVVEQIDMDGYNNPPPTPTPFDSGVITNLQSGDKSGMPTEIRVMLITLACLVAALGLFAAVRFILLLTGASGYYRRLCRKYDSAGDRVNACYSKIVRQSSFLGVKQEAGDTISTFARRVDLSLGSHEMTELSECVIRMRFALEQPSDDDVKKLCAFSAALEKRLRIELGISGYLWRRLLLGR